MDIRPLTLEGTVVRLEPFQREHWKALWEVAKDNTEDIFRWIPYPMRTAEDFKEWSDKAFAEQAASRWCSRQSSALRAN